MRICRIRNEYPGGPDVVGYLFYYENARRFYIEIADGLDYWSAPPLFDWYVKKGIECMDASWSFRWVSARIVPPDRQNIAQVLRNSGMDSYDEYKLLLYADGRCAQDDCMVEEIREEELPAYIIERMKQHIQAVFPLTENRVILFFRNNTSCVCDIADTSGRDPRFSRILRSQDVFSDVRVSEGGYGIRWDDEREIPYYVLSQAPVDYSLNYRDICCIIEHETFDTAQVTERLNCSRQNIDDLVRRGRLHPVKTGARSKLFIRSEVEERLW